MNVLAISLVAMSAAALDSPIPQSGLDEFIAYQSEPVGCVGSTSADCPFYAIAMPSAARNCQPLGQASRFTKPNGKSIWGSRVPVSIAPKLTRPNQQPDIFQTDRRIIDAVVTVTDEHAVACLAAEMRIDGRSYTMTPLTDPMTLASLETVKTGSAQRQLCEAALLRRMGQQTCAVWSKSLFERLSDWIMGNDSNSVIRVIISAPQRSSVVVDNRVVATTNFDGFLAPYALKRAAIVSPGQRKSSQDCRRSYDGRVFTLAC